MKKILSVLLTMTVGLGALAADGPVRVAYKNAKALAEAERQQVHVWMRDLGRDAIWFDVGADLDAGNYDVVLGAVSDLPKEADAAKAAVLAKLSPERKKSYEAFLSQREEEKREPRATVANYEKRAQPLTFQIPMSVKASMERTQVPADCELSLFAAEPDIAKPIALAWDERGRCWVAETRDYPHGVYENGQGQDSIKICEDTNGDGKADKFTVFADKLNIPTGLVLVKGGVIVSQPPRFLLLKDTNGDDKADERTEIMTGWGIHDTHAQASSLHYGMDNWLYGCVGYSGFKGVVNGEEKSFAMGTYRFRPDGSGLEFLHQFTNNSWGHSQNAAGDQFGGTANGAPLFFGGIPATAYPKDMRSMTAKKINEVEECHTITPNYRQVDVFGGYTAAAGSNIIESPALPARFQNCALICEPTMKLVAALKLEHAGAGYTAKDEFNLFASSDEWTSPVHAEVGPDGAVWVADFQNFIIQHNPTPSPERGGYAAKTGVGGAHENELRDHARGRIYRVWGKGMKLETGTPSLSSGTLTARLIAQRLAVESGADVSPAKEGSAAVHALWVKHGRGQLSTEEHRAALLSKDPVIRRNGIRALGLDEKAQELFFGAGVVSDPDLRTRLAALVKLAEFPTTPEIKTLVAKLPLDPVVKEDEWLSEAARLLVRKHKAQSYKLGTNLLVNAGLEKLGADGLPEGWKRRDYGDREKNKSAEWKALPAAAHSGQVGVRCISRDNADTSLFQDVPLKRGATYVLSGWVKTHAMRGKVSFNDHIGRAETDQVKARESDWVQVEVMWTNKDKDKASINILHVGKGDGFFDDLSLAEALPVDDEEKVIAGDLKRGEDIFWKHPVAACKNCHLLKGQGSAVGPALDGIASRKDEAYITESLLNPNARLAEGYVATPISPMPPMGLILKPQELADVKAFILSLK